MTIHPLFEFWEKSFAGELTEEEYRLRLPVEDVAKIEALAEMYPKRSKECIITDLISAALEELVVSLPYVQGNHVVGRDEEGDPLYEDVGPTPRYLELTRKHMNDYQQRHRE
jgi:hypothetical protein